MGREVRKVPATWEHPKDRSGAFVPMMATFPYTDEDIREGIQDGWLEGDPPHYGYDVMPQWPELERTHYQMYETATDGTPISPVMETPEALARWLADHGASAFASQTAAYEEWLSAIQCGSVASVVITLPTTPSVKD